MLIENRGSTGVRYCECKVFVRKVEKCLDQTNLQRAYMNWLKLNSVVFIFIIIVGDIISINSILLTIITSILGL